MEFTQKLFRYTYTYRVQGTEEDDTEYALLNVPVNATFNNNRSTLFNKRNREYYHEIDIESVVDLSIDF